ncbi:putative protein STRUBBELIG-RECEPTOR FAMILY 3-like [Cocos nucifera]|uniref:Protein kinase domain-containing protein n=1 Tax=Cocos nucifera TaxID=13894 RepID=A0A8K0IC58_COCNU|nr:putative protein STRUBBELIG-RECEPTOR FAMILY 3-like [Cocos nucifera]
MPPQPSSPLSKAPPVPRTMPANSSDGPSAQQSAPPGKKKHLSTMRVIGYVLIAVVLFIVVVLMVIFCMSKYQERKSKHGELYKSQVGRVSKGSKEPRTKEHLIMPKDEVKESVAKEVPEERKRDTRITVPEETFEKQKEHVIEMEGTSILVMPPPPVEKVIVNPIAPAENIARSPPPEQICPPTSAISFSVASLQQYTDSFTEESLIRDSRLGKVYLAELPDGKLLEVMKIDNVNSRIPVDVFLELVANISELRHPNIVELVGYCAEFGQRLLVYKYFSRKTLHDILHCGDYLNRKLSWNARLQVALGAAKALEYLHEGCQPPIVHQNFEPANVLIDDELAIRVSECDLASLMSSISVTQLSGRMRALYSHEAPELNESGTHTDRSDVYSFGVVMLELLTGRKPFDGSRPRVEQHLVRWASSQLHDINALSKMVDPSIGGKYSEKSLSRFADIISRCIQVLMLEIAMQQGPEFRPPMSEVVQDLTRMSLCGHTCAVESVAIDSAEVLVLSGSSNGTIKLWDLEGAKIHPFGGFFASGSLDADLKIWDIRKKGCIHTYKGDTHGIRTIKFTPDGRWVVTGGEDNAVKLWDLTAGKLLHDFKFHNGQIQCIDFHLHEFLLATGSADRTVKFWDLETFELIGSAGPEATGVCFMIFHPDGRTLFCGFDVTFKIFSWEPIRCHDVVDMGWSTLADLSIHDGKLLGCSYHGSHVGLIGPYAVGAVSKTNALMEPISSNGEDHSTKLMESSTKYSSPLITGHHDCGNKLKESALQGINSNVSSMAPMNSTEARRNKSTISSHSTVQKLIHNLLPKHPLANNSLRKGSMMEANAIGNVQAIANPVSMPVIVPRDSLNQDTAGSSRNVTADAEATTQGSMLGKPIHIWKPCFLGGCNESKLIATGSGPLNGMSNNLHILDPNLCSKTAVNHEVAKADERNHTSMRNVAENIMLNHHAQTVKRIQSNMSEELKAGKEEKEVTAVIQQQLVLPLTEPSEPTIWHPSRLIVFILSNEEEGCLQHMLRN